MRKNSPEYKLWIERRNKKNLKKRTKRKLAKKRKQSSLSNYNREIKKEAIYNPKTDNFTFTAPLDFSIVNNPVETTGFFNKIIGFITDKRNFGKKLFIDISKIQSLTTDALMYLLALVNNLSEHFANKYHFSGNEPTDARIRKLFTESGFYKFVKYRGTEPLTHSNDNIQIVSGEQYSNDFAKQLTDYVCDKAQTTKENCKFLYEMLIELMNNTQKHAYDNDNLLFPLWYCFAEYDSQSSVTFTFMDTGSGIPTTVQKNFSERIDFLKLKGENKYVISALNGEFRTATRQMHRGKGLPKIREFCSKGVIKNLHILTNKADVIVRPSSYDGKDLQVQLRGTLYQWEIDLSQLKGAQI